MKNLKNIMQVLNENFKQSSYDSLREYVEAEA